MASLIVCFKCRVEIRTKQQKVDCRNCKNWFHRVLCSGISTKEWKENSAVLKTEFICSDCSPIQQTGQSFSLSASSFTMSSSTATGFCGFPSLVYDVPSFALPDSLLTTSFPTSVFQDFSNLAINDNPVINGNVTLQENVTKAPSAADSNAAVSTNVFNLQEYIADFSARPQNQLVNKIAADINDSISEAVVPTTSCILVSGIPPPTTLCTNDLLTDADLSFPPPPPPLTPTNITYDLESDNDFSLPPPPSPVDDEHLFFVTNAILINLAPPPEFATDNDGLPCNNELELFRPNFNSSYNCDANLSMGTFPGAQALEWPNCSPVISPVEEQGGANFPPTYDVAEVPIHRTPDRPLRQLKYTFHFECSNKKRNILFDGLGFRYSKGPKSTTWRCTSRSKNIGCCAKVSFTNYLISS